jgi:hypothetical protein
MTNKLNLHQRIAAVMQEVTYIQKEEKKGMQFKIVSHDKVTAKCRPALLAQGVICYPIRCDTSQNGNRTECNMTVRFVNVDDPQDLIDVESCGHGIDNQDKGPGKAQSYAMKYALLKALNLETGDDADHDSIEHSRADPTPPTKTTQEKVNDAKTANDINGLIAEVKALNHPAANEHLHKQATALHLHYNKEASKYVAIE